jgi:hypothetical protein
MNDSRTEIRKVQSLILKYYLKEVLNREDDGFDVVLNSEMLAKSK